MQVAPLMGWLRIILTLFVAESRNEANYETLSESEFCLGFIASVTGKPKGRRAVAK